MDRWDTIRYTACEIDRTAAHVALSQHPGTKQLGKLKNFTEAQLMRFVSRVEPQDDVLYTAVFSCNPILNRRVRKDSEAPSPGSYGTSLDYETDLGTSLLYIALL